MIVPILTQELQGCFVRGVLLSEANSPPEGHMTYCHGDAAILNC